MYPSPKTSEKTAIPRRDDWRPSPFEAGEGRRGDDHAARDPYLLVVEGENAGCLLELSWSPALLGRDPDSDVFFADRGLSRRHALFERQERHTSLMDLNSTNGTFVNGAQIPGEVATRLRHGDYLQFGPGVVLKYVELSREERDFQIEVLDGKFLDQSTNLPNRRTFTHLLLPTSQRFRAAGRGMGVACAAVDPTELSKAAPNLAARIETMRAVALLFRKAVGEECSAGLLDADRFALAFPADSLDEAAETAEVVRANVALNAIRTQDQSHRLTASLGVVHVPREATGAGLAEALAAAERLLERAMEAGGNRARAESMSAAGS